MTERDVDRESAPERSGEPSAGDDIGDVSPCYHAYIERNDHRPDTCTVYSMLNGDSVANTWIRARGDAFVAREDAR
jgi:hypothetical protein